MSRKEKSGDKIELVLLRSTNDDYQLNLIKGLLKDADIPYIIKERGSGGYMKIIGGISVFGTDIYVDKTTFEKAEEILDSFQWE